MPSLKLSNLLRRGDGRPSLKERAAALKASAARVLKRPERAVASSSNARAVYVDPIGEDGLMTYLDAAGNQHRQPVGHWIAFMSQRMYSIARRDYDRRFRDYPSERLDGDGWIRLDAQLRRELSLDALKVLAFKPLSVFDAVEAETAPVDSDERRPDAALIALCNEAAREERTAQIKCNTDDEPADGESEPDYWGRSGDLLAQAKAAKPASLRGLAAKAKVVLAHAPEALELGAQPFVYELAMALMRDVVRIGREDDTFEAPDPIHAAIAASREAQAAYETWERGARGRMTKAKFAEEDRLVAEQSRTREAAFATVPTTRAGQLALLDYARDYLRLQLGFRSQSDDADVDVEALIWRTAYRALEASLRAGVSAEALAGRGA